MNMNMDIFEKQINNIVLQYGNTRCEEFDHYLDIDNERKTHIFKIPEKNRFEFNYNEYKSAFVNSPNLICYAVKANSNLSILSLLKNLGSGFDIVSGGELQRVLQIGADPKKIVFSGVGKTRVEIEDAIASNIGSINIESDDELNLVSEIAERKQIKAHVSLRVNPNVDPKTHPYISTGLKNSKFGVPIERALELYRKMQGHKYLQIVVLPAPDGEEIIIILFF